MREYTDIPCDVFIDEMKSSLSDIEMAILTHIRMIQKMTNSKMTLHLRVGEEFWHITYVEPDSFRVKRYAATKTDS